MSFKTREADEPYQCVDRLADLLWLLHIVKNEAYQVMVQFNTQVPFVGRHRPLVGKK